MEWEFGISRSKLLYTEWINNKVLLYSTENQIQYPMINHIERILKEYIYVTESLCCIGKINTLVSQ